MEKPIVLATKKELDIYVNPRRQELMRMMNILNRPVTPKELSRKLDISASSVQHHITKLEALGVIQLHHTEQIRGITARYYYMPPRMVNLGRTPDSAENEQQIAIMQNSLANIFTGFAQYFETCEDPPQEALGVMSWGILHMEESEVLELKRIVHQFIHEHEKPGTKGIPFEYNIIAYPIDGGADA